MGAPMLETELLLMLGEVIKALIPVVVDALRGGKSSDAIVAGVRAAMVAASDEQMREELGP